MRVVTSLGSWVLHARANRSFASGSLTQSDLPNNGELKRKQTARQLMRLIAGESLQDKYRVQANASVFDPFRSSGCAHSSLRNHSLRL